MSLEVVKLEDRNNSLLNRREIKVILKNSAGKVKRVEAAATIAKQLDIDKKTIIPIKMSCENGTTNIRASFYIYSSDEEAKKQLPRYRLLRNMPKDDRKKLIDEEKAARLKAKQTSVSESKSGTKRGRK
jgi:small subunit ribosomal protein S24e